MYKLSEHFRAVNSPVWDIDQERLLMETLVNQRTNFLLIFFAFVVAGAINADSRLILIVILSIGFLICSILGYVIFRAYIRWDIIIRKIYKDGFHPATFVNRVVKIKRALKGPSARPIIGLVLPVICSTILLLGLIFVLCGCYSPKDSSPKIEIRDGKNLHIYGDKPYNINDSNLRPHKHHK